MTARRLLSAAVAASTLTASTLVVDGARAQAAAAPSEPSADLARQVGQAARQVASTADELADEALPADSAGADPKSPMERAREGVVVLERGGTPIAVGTVLDGDGRILTALSPLTHGNAIDARFADGTVSRVRIGHTDRGWDLALLIPQNSRWKTGLKPSRKSATAAGLALRAFSRVGNKRVAVSRAIVRGTSTLLGGDSALLRDALELASRYKSTEMGTPIVDEDGNVVAMVASACDPAVTEACKQVNYGVPVSAVKAFLRTVPADAVPPAPWLGIQGVSADVGPVRGVRVLGVHPDSPAAAAGLRGGTDEATSDVVVAVDGTPVLTPEALADTINRRAVGESVELLLFGGGKFRQVSLVLRPAPDKEGDTARQLRSPRRQRPRPVRPR